MKGQSFKVTPLAKGEYYLNYLLKGQEKTMVFQVDIRG